MGSNDTPPAVARKGMRGLWIFFAGVAVAWFVSAFVLREFIPSLESRGTFGDSFGALNALFSGLAFAGVVYAILQQNESRDQQNEALRLQSRALDQQAKSLKQQAEALALQQQELRAQIDEMQATRDQVRRQADAAEKQEAALGAQRGAQLLAAAIAGVTSRINVIDQIWRALPADDDRDLEQRDRATDLTSELEERVNLLNTLLDLATKELGIQP